jgi:hypothetical protein
VRVPTLILVFAWLSIHWGHCYAEKPAIILEEGNASGLICVPPMYHKSPMDSQYLDWEIRPADPISGMNQTIGEFQRRINGVAFQRLHVSVVDSGKYSFELNAGPAFTIAGNEKQSERVVIAFKAEAKALDKLAFRFYYYETASCPEDIFLYSATVVEKTTNNTLNIDE